MSEEAVIVAGARTAIGTSYKGSLVETDAFTLATAVVKEAVRRANIDPELYDDVILGESLYGGGAIARYAAIEAGLVNAPGVAQNRHCASGLATVSAAAATVMAGMDKVVIAGGVQSASTAPVVKWTDPATGAVDENWIAPSHRETPASPARDMAYCIGWNTAVKAGISREDMDAWAYRSHMRALAGIDNGSFRDEIVPIEVTKGGTAFTFDTDEHPRRSTTLEKLATLKPLHPEIEGFSVTAGNSSGINDAAGAVVVTSREFAEAHGLEPLAVIRSWASAGVPPEDSGFGPVRAIPKALDRAGLKIGDIDLWEINEAFASVPIATVRELGLDDAIVNVLGSGCSLGHPVAMTGTRMVLTLTHELRRRGGGTAMATMCVGGGMGSALVLEVPAPK